MDANKAIDPILITGGGGFLGQHLANDLVRYKYRVVLFDIIKNTSLLGNHVGSENCKIISGDILEFSELIDVITRQRVKSIIHAAAILPPTSDLRPHKSIQVNILGTCNVLEAARLLKLGRVIFVSSGAVYDPKNIICNEDSPIPLDVSYGLYGCGKASSELIGLKYSLMYCVDFVSTRHAVIYGPGVTSQHYLNILVSNAINGKRMKLKNGNDHRFEFLHVKDAASGIRLILTNRNLKYRIYNVGTGKTHSLAELAAIIKKILPDVDIELGPGLLPHLPQRGPFDISRLRELGYRLQFDLEKGLMEYINSVS